MAKLVGIRLDSNGELRITGRSDLSLAGNSRGLELRSGLAKPITLPMDKVKGITIVGTAGDDSIKVDNLDRFYRNGRGLTRVSINPGAGADKVDLELGKASYHVQSSGPKINKVQIVDKNIAVVGFKRDEVNISGEKGKLAISIPIENNPFGSVPDISYKADEGEPVHSFTGMQEGKKYVIEFEDSNPKNLDVYIGNSKRPERLKFELKELPVKPDNTSLEVI